MRIVLAVGLAIILAELTAQQTARWQSDRTVWCAAQQRVPKKPRALNNCALALIRDGEYAQALPLLNAGLLTVGSREPNRRTALQMALRTNQFLALYALHRLDDAKVTLAAMDPADHRTQRFAAWMSE